MKKIFIGIIVGLIACIFTFGTVKAEVYYTNQYGVDFTEQQYRFYTEMFYDGYQENVTQTDFDTVYNLGLFDERIEKESFTFLPLNQYELNYPTNGQNGRTISIGKSCSSQCFYSLSVVWSATPNINSWDVFGARVTNGSITSIGTLYVTATGYSDSQSNPDVQSNGFGYSVAVPPLSGTTLSTSFYTTAGTTGYGSYQHATTSVSLATSKLYYINFMGYGSVFDFYGAAVGVYDACNGVSI